MAKYDKETKFYWLQLKEDFFDDDAIEWLEEQENGHKYSLFYLKLCLKSLKSNGVLIRKVGNMLVPYDNKKLADLTKTPIDTVIVAMELLKGIGLVQVLESGELYITQLENMIGSTSKGAFKKQQQLARRKKEQKEIENKSKDLLIEPDEQFEDLPKLNICKRLSREQILLPSGQTIFIDEKRYGGNGGLAYERAEGKCEDCGTTENLRIHHENGYSNDLNDLIILCSKCHGYHHSKEYKNQLEQEWNEGGKNSTKDKDKIKNKTKDKDKIKHIYGEYQNVRLTEKELQSLKSSYGDDLTNKLITYLDEYIEMKGYKARSHYLCIKKWVINAVKEKENKYTKQPTRKEELPEWFNKELKNEPMTPEEQEEFDRELEELQKMLAENY